MREYFGKIKPKAILKGTAVSSVLLSIVKSFKNGGDTICLHTITNGMAYRKSTEHKVQNLYPYYQGSKSQINLKFNLPVTTVITIYY